MTAAARPLAYQDLPADVTRPLYELGGYLAGIVGWLALLGLLSAAARAVVRYLNGAGYHDLWKEIVVFMLCAGISVHTFDLANFLHP